MLRIDEAGDRLADREIAQADDRPAQLLARKVGEFEIACQRRAVGLLAEGPARAERQRREHARGEQAAASDICFVVVRHVIPS
jgi:hypothetical protein